MYPETTTNIVLNPIKAILPPVRHTMRYLLSIIITVLLSAFSAENINGKKNAQSPGKDKVFTVVIDAGHGGKDIGCKGKITNEKTINLAVAKLLGAKIKDNHPEVNIVYTRDNDTYLTLDQRAKKANSAKGDLFISIHVNSVDYKSKNRSTVHGASVYTLGLHKSSSNLSVAMRENSVMALDDNYQETYSGFDPNSSESYIIFELSQDAHISRSLQFADLAQTQLVNHAGRSDKDVRQAGFWVLWATSMPAVLVELDFICNPEQERFLDSDHGKELCAQALSNAFTSYYSHISGKSVSHNTSTPTEPIKNDTVAETSSVTSQQADNASPTYHIQICSIDKPLSKNDRLYKTCPDVGFYKDGNLYKYYTGTYQSLNAAKNDLKDIKKLFPQAFIIKLLNGSRVN